MMLTGKRHDFRVDYTAGFDTKGRVTAVDVDFLARCGYSADLSNAICDRTMFHADNAYFYPAARIATRRLRTNTVSNTAFRGFGGPQGMLFAERLMEVIAMRTGQDPLDVRTDPEKVAFLESLDRHARAMVMDFAAWESAVLGYESLPDYSRWGWMLQGRMKSATTAMMDRFDVRPRDIELLGSKFSGGNQQKLVLARELGQSPKVLLVGQPTRGVDIGAIEFIYGQLRRLRDAGCAVLLVSSELDEILALSDRVMVMCQGRVTGELPVADCTEMRLGVLMTGGQLH